MSKPTNSKVQADVWLKPDQVESLRSACYSVGADYLQQRNEAIIALLADTGLRVGELVALDVDYLRDGNSALYLPADVQKDYPTDSSPNAATLELADDVSRLLSSYLTNRWKNSDALFPSRSSDRITRKGFVICSTRWLQKPRSNRTGGWVAWRCRRRDAAHIPPQRRLPDDER